MRIGVKLTHERFFNDVAEVLRLFFPHAEVALDTDGDAHMHISAAPGEGVCALFAYDGAKGRALLPHPEHDEELIRKRLLKRAYKLTAYRALKQLYGRPSPWGSLTGIRPTKFLRSLMQETPDAAAALRDDFDVSNEKAALLYETLETQRPLLHEGGEIDVYVGIPFCASRCAYCSFAAEVPTGYSRVSSYLEALFHEMDACKGLARRGVRSVYIGGGTPTALSERDLERLLEKAAALSPALEFAVEAGRPDTLSAEKLALMKKHGVTRTSVNPQTMSDATLERIGRKHTSADTIRAFALARDSGLPINADIIVGLPGEGRDDLAYTLDMLCMLSPEGFTAHTLALKRASRLVMDGAATHIDANEAAELLSMTRGASKAMGMRPYYLYRQKYMAGNLENVGYSKPGFECVYNIDIMEETTSILAFGAGAITKWIFGGGRLERQPNPKDIDTYIGKVGELIKRKKELGCAEFDA